MAKDIVETMLSDAMNPDSLTYQRDKRRIETQDKTKRYESLAFPAYLGSSIRSDSFLVAYMIAIYRSFQYAEARVIDHKTKKHYVI